MCLSEKTTIFPFYDWTGTEVLASLREEGFTEEEVRLGSTAKHPVCIVTTGRATTYMERRYVSTKGKLIERPVEAGGGFD